jgi:hypothetical protein
MIGERRMLIVMKSRYNMRKGQSQVKEKADAVLARTDAFNFIWRANATKECFAFQGLCPKNKRLRSRHLFFMRC